MSLSKPLLNLAASYLQNLYLNPIKTKSITSSVFATLANYASQSITGEKLINYESMIAFGLFGLLFGGFVPHYFYSNIESWKLSLVMRMLVERLLYMPLFQFLQLYMVSILEGKSHVTSLNSTMSIVCKVVKANWKWLSVFQFINLRYVPPVLRVLYGNVLAFFWVMYLAKVRSVEFKRNQDRIERTRRSNLAKENKTV